MSRWSSLPKTPPNNTPETLRLYDQIMGLRDVYREVLERQRDKVLRSILQGQVAALDRVLTLFFTPPTPNPSPLKETILPERDL